MNELKWKCKSKLKITKKHECLWRNVGKQEVRERRVKKKSWWTFFFFSFRRLTRRIERKSSFIVFSYYVWICDLATELYYLLLRFKQFCKRSSKSHSNSFRECETGEVSYHKISLIFVSSFVTGSKNIELFSWTLIELIQKMTSHIIFLTLGLIFGQSGHKLLPASYEVPILLPYNFKKIFFWCDVPHLAVFIIFISSFCHRVDLSI